MVMEMFSVFCDETWFKQNDESNKQMYAVEEASLRLGGGGLLLTLIGVFDMREEASF